MTKDTDRDPKVPVTALDLRALLIEKIEKSIAEHEAGYPCSHHEFRAGMREVLRTVRVTDVAGPDGAIVDGDDTEDGDEPVGRCPMTPEQHAHAQALNEAHDLFGGRPLRLSENKAEQLAARERWIAAREKHLTNNYSAAGGSR